MSSHRLQCGALCGVLLALASQASAQAEPAYRVAATYAGELWRNAHGGLRTGSRYLANLDLQLEIDGESAWGRRGLEVFAYALYNNGHSVSADLVGDAQAISNIEAVETVRLYELWGEWSFGADASHSLRFGLYDLNSEF